MEYPYPTKYNDTWELETITVRDIFWQASKKERIELAKSNPCIFGEQYIKPCIKQWIYNTAKHQYYMLYEALTNDNIVIHIPMEHAKSTWFSLVLPLWFLINDRNTYGCILSNTATQATGFLSAIKWHIEHNEKFREDFPEIRPDYKSKWAENEINIIRDKDKQSKDYTMVAKGTGNAILGARFEWIIADDILDLENTATEIQRNKVRKWWNQTVDSRIIEGGRKIIIGTLQHDKDLLVELGEKKDIYKYINLKALYNNKIPLWEEQWSLKRLLYKKASIGILDFNKTMQNDRESTQNKSLDRKWLNYYGPTEHYNFKIHNPNVRIYIGIDPAIADDKTTAEKRRLDKFALMVTGFDLTSKLIFVWDYLQGYFTFPEQIEIIDKQYKRYKEINVVKGIGIEQTAYQKALKQQAFLLSSLPPIRGVNTGTSSKATRIDSLGVYFQSKRIYVKRSHDSLIDEFVSYEPGGLSPNLLDALCIIITMITGVSTISDIKVHTKNIFKNERSFITQW
jgi:hypothetical protein